MTPLTRFLMKRLPRWAVGSALALVYAVTLLAVLLLISRVEQHMLYLDIAASATRNESARIFEKSGQSLSLLSSMSPIATAFWSTLARHQGILQKP